MLTYLLIATTTLCTLVAQLILKRAVNVPAMRAALEDGPLQFVLAAALNPLVWVALMLQVAGYITWFFVLTREKLAVSFAISGAMVYTIMAFAAWYFYGERLGALQWVGIMMISAGVLFVVTQN